MVRVRDSVDVFFLHCTAQSEQSMDIVHWTAGVWADERREGEMLEAVCSHTIQAQTLGCSSYIRTSIA